MKFSAKALILFAGAIAFSGVALGQQRLDLGKSEYEAKCAACHGMDARGGGTLQPHLVSAPSDLTTLSQRYGGAFPTEMVWETIDGRATMAMGPHGAREMPLWGATYRMQAVAQHAPAPEWYVREKIVALLDYLASIQQR